MVKGSFQLAAVDKECHTIATRVKLLPVVVSLFKLDRFVETSRASELVLEMHLLLLRLNFFVFTLSSTQAD